MADISREEFLRLQGEAQNRLKEMQRRSEEAVGKIPPAPDFVMLRRDESELPEKQNREPAPEKSRGGFDILRMFNFKNITMDSDRVLILAVLLLLAGNSSDELLLFALVYIML